MNIEERLGAALQVEADRLDGGRSHPGEERAAWVAVQAAAAHRRSRRHAGRMMSGGLAAAAVVAVTLAVLATVARDRDERLEVGPAGSETTVDRDAPSTSATTEAATSATTSATGSGPTSSPPVAIVGVWPFATQDDVDAYDAKGDRTYADAETTAVAFAKTYLGMPQPIVVNPRGAAASAVGSSFEVVVRPKRGSPMATTLYMRQVGSGWTVSAARTANIRLEHPKERAEVGRTVSVAGTSTAFEATVQVEVRQAGQVFGQRLGSSFVMGGANGEMGPFAVEVKVDGTTRPAGAVVLFTDSAEDGSVQEATVVPVAFAADVTRVSIFFHRGDKLVEVSRSTPRTTSVLRTALETLFAGPRPEDGDGLSSLFSVQTADLLAGVALRSDGTAVIDLAREVNNGSTSAGSQALLEEMNATAFQFSTVERIEYRLKGSCDAFWTWIQVGSCRLVPRP
jgi:hypothetical protein